MKLILLLITVVPLLAYLLDGYYRKNINRGIVQIVAFIITAIITITLVTYFGLLFIMTVPFLLALLITIFRKYEK
ncbi:MAG TPA: hypothetical protein ENK46_10755 [Flavobacteriia bacterium]|nr:hypothetical protein [Flavobacteriia bacterium]